MNYLSAATESSLILNHGNQATVCVRVCKCDGCRELQGLLFVMQPLQFNPFIYQAVCIFMSLSSHPFEPSSTSYLSSWASPHKIPFLFFSPFPSLFRAWSWKLGLCVVWQLLLHAFFLSPSLSSPSPLLFFKHASSFLNYLSCWQGQWGL